MQWIYKHLDIFGYYAVGYYTPSGRFFIAEEHQTLDSAVNRIAYLNGNPSSLAFDFIEHSDREW